MASLLDEEIPSDSELSSQEPDSDALITDEDEETVQQKKIRLAKNLIHQLEKQKESQALEKDQTAYVVRKLEEDLASKTGKLKKQIADKYTAGLIEKQLKGHRLSVTCVAISPNKKYIFSTSKDGTIIKWNFESGMKMNTIKKRLPHEDRTTKKGHSKEVYALAISDDGKYLASGGGDKLIKIWNPETLDFVYSFEGHRDSVSGLVFRNNSHQLYSCSFDRSVKIWNVDQLIYVETLFGHQDRILGIDSLNKERCVTCGARDRSLRLWKIVEESQLLFNGIHFDSIDCVSLINEEFFLSGSNDSSLSIWSINKKKPILVHKNAHKNNSMLDTKKSLFGNSFEAANWVSAVRAYHNSDLLASGSDDGFIRIWAYSSANNSLNERFKIPVEGFVNDLKFSEDGSYLIAGVGQEHKLGRWSINKNAKNSILIIKLISEDFNK
ncbi:U3 small nucleolar RNA-interacting 2 isoform X2 [Brachionus plicatilis]|uniref:U3 small nucleolar RNA-interacting 2 isoform X2 n=1 Tax=Brachionus plicatilis TaxID=10195 RepID=A0A3M7QHR4_BRAPC|nr:U3 small nucleolar RNA-interacting 2 isoform X2 [Brachionus plicatilis]